MKKSIKSKLKRAAMYLLGFSATPMLTACYGLAYSDDVIGPIPFEDIHGTVYSEDGEPIPGIKVSSPEYKISTITDSEGKFHLDQYFDAPPVRITADDIDGEQNGKFYHSATIVTDADNDNANIKMFKMK